MSSYKKKVLEARKKILELTNEQLKQIDEIYAKSATRLIDEILELPDISRTRVHDIDIARLLNEYTKDLYKQLYPNVTENMMESSIIQRQVILDYVDQVAKDRTLSKIVKNNINIYSNKVVKTLIAGEYYKDGKTLSKRLWNLTQENGSKIDEFIKMNIASGANARKLANDLEILINPKKRLVTNNFKAGFDSYKVSYQAQRLARTSITHTATETQIQNAKKNPFNRGLKWNLSASHGARMHGKQDECDDREGKVYKPNETPLQHPNCMCYFTEEVADIDDAIARINKWVDGGEDKELDKWCEGFDRTKKEDSKASKQTVKVNSKDGTINIKVPKDKNNSENKSNKRYNISKSDIVKNDSLTSNKIKYIPKESNVDWKKYIDVNEKQSNTLNKIHSELNKFIIEEDREKIALFNRKDDKVYEQEGKLIDEVKLSKEIKKVLKSSPENSIIFIHNHNTPTTFSGSDIKHIIKYEAIEMMTLECADGTKYVLGRGSAKSSFKNKLYFEATYDEIYKKIAEKYPDLNDEVKKYYVWDDFLDEVTREVAKKYGMIYKKVIE